MTKKAIVEGYEFVATEVNVSRDFVSYAAPKGINTFDAGGAEVEVRLQAYMSDKEISELFASVQNSRMLVVVKR